MKYLSDYTRGLQTEAFNETGSFFCFSAEQFEAKRKVNVLYVNLGTGLMCPVDNIELLKLKLSEIQAEGIRMDIAENGIPAIIQRELGNYECQITGDYSPVVDVLEQYGVTEEQVSEAYKDFYNLCIENNWF